MPCFDPYALDENGNFIPESGDCMGFEIKNKSTNIPICIYNEKIVSRVVFTLEKIYQLLFFLLWERGQYYIHQVMRTLKGCNRPNALDVWLVNFFPFFFFFLRMYYLEAAI